jgi:glucokinase
MAESPDNTSRLVGVEASVSTFFSVCLDHDGRVMNASETPVDRSGEPISQLIDHINGLKNTFGQFDRVGIAVPGLIEKGNSRVAYSAHIPEHARADLPAEVEKATGVKTTVENDANAAAYGEFKLGAGRGSRDMFYATLGAGIGGAFIIGSEIWRGVSGFAGEFGFVAVNSDGMRLEDVASTANIVRRTRNRFHQDSTSSLNKLEETEIRIRDIIDAADRQDDFAALMLERTGNYVGTAIASVINLLNIERIVVGGEIMEAGQVVLDSIIRRARELSFTPSFNSTKIAAGELGQNASAIGAALLARQ